jgi:predicted chitinase
MLLSPPFLVPRNANETEEAWIDRCMPGGNPGDGAFPISFNLSWHGGVHLTAPALAEGIAAVRAIADGTVVFVRQPTPQPSGQLPPGHPLAYRGGWTDDGVVVIRHDTEIGEGEPGSVHFFSVYAHLSRVDAALATGRNVYRRQVVGEAGQIYGDLARKIHFELICDDANVQRLFGRANGTVSLAANGRTAVIFGEIYVHVPRGTPVYAQCPVATSAAAMAVPAGSPSGAPAQPLQPIATLGADAIVGIQYGGGIGLPGHKADAVVTTYTRDGVPVGQVEEVGAEYELYELVKRQSEAFPAQSRPTASALYKLRRFGRVTAPETIPDDVPHWRRIAYDGGTGWVDLNAQGVHVFSDADFPDWRGWSIVDDSADLDARCDSPTVRGWLDVNQDGVVSLQEAQARLSVHDVVARCRRAICKFPTEWDASSVEQRWGWLKSTTPENATPLSDEDFGELRRHIEALSFWTPALGIPSSHWHLPPQEFIRAFRRCTWMSDRELAQCIPRNCQLGNTPWATAQTRGRDHRTSISMLFWKYGAVSTARKVHYLAQIYIETGLLRLVREGGQGAPNPSIPKAQHYAAFYGRGYMQLTWASNYAKYGEYRGMPNHVGAYADARITATSTHVWADFNPPAQPVMRQWAPRYDPDLVASDDYSCADSAGHYWVSKSFRGTSDLTRVADLGLEPRFVGYISWLVNGGGNGYRERQQFAKYVENVLGDAVPLTGTETLAYPSLSPALTGAFPPGNPVNTQNVQVNHAHQRP